MTLGVALLRSQSHIRSLRLRCHCPPDCFNGRAGGRGLQRRVESALARAFHPLNATCDVMIAYRVAERIVAGYEEHCSASQEEWRVGRSRPWRRGRDGPRVVCLRVGGGCV